MINATRACWTLTTSFPQLFNFSTKKIYLTLIWQGNSNVLNIDSKRGSVGFTSVLIPSVYPVSIIRVDEQVWLNTRVVIIIVVVIVIFTSLLIPSDDQRHQFNSNQLLLMSTQFLHHSNIPISLWCTKITLSILNTLFSKLCELVFHCHHHHHHGQHHHHHGHHLHGNLADNASARSRWPLCSLPAWRARRIRWQNCPKSPVEVHFYIIIVS